MGNCLSCLGVKRTQDQDYTPESSRLLYDDQYQTQYGTDASRIAHSPQLDAEQQRQEREELERIIAKTSNKFIDVTQPARIDDGPKVSVDYGRLFRETFTADDRASKSPHSHADEGRTETEALNGSIWLQRIIESDSQERLWDPRIVRKAKGKLTFTFDDVLAVGPPE